jgi:hypothetical protein
VYISEGTNHRVQKFASPPEITAIEDVPGDQGGYVRITFTRSSAEASPGGELYQYRVLRFNPPNGVVALNFAPGPTMVVVPSGGDSNDDFDGVAQYELIGLLSVPNGGPLQYESYGFSTDDLAPPAPAPFTAGLFHWTTRHTSTGVLPPQPTSGSTACQRATASRGRPSPLTGHRLRRRWPHGQLLPHRRGRHVGQRRAAAGPWAG